jgi:hypothetical protein
VDINTIIMSVSGSKGLTNLQFSLSFVVQIFIFVGQCVSDAYAAGIERVDVYAFMWYDRGLFVDPLTK